MQKLPNTTSQQKAAHHLLIHAQNFIETRHGACILMIYDMACCLQVVQNNMGSCDRLCAVYSTVHINVDKHQNNSFQ